MAGQRWEQEGPVSGALVGVRQGLVVYCQAPPRNPLRSAQIIARIAASVAAAGACGVRIDTPGHIVEVKKTVDTTVIGLWKADSDGVYITPTLEHARAVVEAGADIVAIDGTGRPRPDGRDLAEVIRRLHDDLGAVVLADVASIAEGVAAAEAGADAVATTLAGTAGGVRTQEGPALDVLAGLQARLDVPVLAEGGITRPDQARAALDHGAWCVVIGKAITSPDWITARFVAAIDYPERGPDGAAADRPAPERRTAERRTAERRQEEDPCDT